MAIISISPSTIPGLIKSIGADRTAAIISSITPYTTCREISKPSTIVFDTLDYLQKNDKVVWTSIEPKLCTKTGSFNNIPGIMWKTSNNVSIGVLDKDYNRCTPAAQKRSFTPNTLKINGDDYHIHNQYSRLFSSSHSLAGFAIFIYKETGGKYFIYCPYGYSGNHELRECTSDSPKYVDDNYKKYEKNNEANVENLDAKNAGEETRSNENTNDDNTKNVESVDAETEVSRLTETCDELVDKLVDSLKKSKNLVLVGAPGMGKHHLALEIANSMKAEVMLVQFHPSYEYADFIEGIRPVQNVGFERKDGVFKQFCKCAINEMKSSDSSATVTVPATHAGIKTLGNYYDDLLCDIRKGKVTAIQTKQKEMNVMGGTSQGNIVLGTVGSDKTYTVSKNDIERLADTFPDPKSWEDKNIDKAITEALGGRHSSSIYGVIHKLYEMRDNDIHHDEGTFVETTKCKPYILIIEDMNRGDASKIFGELHVIDPNNRGEKKVLVQTKYQNLVSVGDVFYKGFYVPENVYIIATMNEIDIPAVKMDFAVRNLFAWKDIVPDDVSKELGELGENAEEAEKRMTNLNKRIADTEDLGPAYVVGPSYFLNLTDGDFEQLWNDVIKPLLDKYLKGFRQSDAILEELKNAYNDYNL